MRFRKIGAAFAAVLLCTGLMSCGEGVVFEDKRQPIDNAIEALKEHNGEKLSDTYFSDNQVEYEAELWSKVSVDDYYDIFSAYLGRVDSYYKEKYGDDYVLEFKDGVFVAIEDENFAEINEKYRYESQNQEDYYFNEGYMDNGTLSIKGSLGEESVNVEIMLVKSDREGWKCYFTDTFFAHFYDDSNETASQ